MPGASGGGAGTLPPTRCREGGREGKGVKPGLYEQLVTRGLARRLDELGQEWRATLHPVDPAEAPHVLTRHLAGALVRALGARKKGAAQVEAVNAVLRSLLEQVQRGEVDEEDLVDERLQELHSLVRMGGPVEVQPPERPSIPLTATDLLVNARGEHRIGAEVLKELRSADRVDLLCSFLKWSGFRLVREGLEELARRGRLRVLTTCYMGATDVQVLDALAGLGEVRVSYDSRRTRLHAKAWLFHRDSGFSTAYIGSSNLSSAALVDGMEWNVRLSQASSPQVLEKFQGTFESYWEDGEFEPYEPSRDRQRFLVAVRRERVDEPGPEYALDVRPYPFQEEILERLEAEREVHGRWKNLVVAATGTGKTVMAALDYRRLRQEWGEARLLFVAHRNEILTQSLSTFRAVLRTGDFGDLWTGTETPTQDRHLFASVQKLSRVDLDRVDPAHFDVLILDEFHHAEAPTYARLLEHFRPRLLLGLTATPERSDGRSVLGWFDGHVAAELRVWDALDRGLLAPFQYFGVHDNTDLRDVPWTRGYDLGELDRVYTGHHARAALIVKELRRHVPRPERMRALGFCAGVGHARFMAGEFQRAGLAAVAVLGDTPADQRRAAIQDLRRGRLQAIFTVDVFNEGLDVPEVDTVLLLRPTESATVFLQQLGRGLRLSPGKECLTVLDFLGYARKEFRFDTLYRALLGGTRREIAEQVGQGFPLLPSGCSMHLDRVATEVVLENLKRNLGAHRGFLRQELQALGPEARLAEFLERSGAELQDLYRGDRPGWVQLRRDLRFPTAPVRPEDEALLRSVARMIHMDSVDQIRAYRRFLEGRAPLEGRLAEMLRFSLWTDEKAAAAHLGMLEEHPAVREELLELLPVLEERVDHQSHPLPEHAEVPLRVHCHYSQSEILAAFGVLTSQTPYRLREGVYHHRPSGCDLFFVTIRKSERDYSPSTLYRDFALSPELFHWESQSGTREDSADGRRYRGHRLGGTHALLFVRETRKDERGETRPYLFLGPAGYVSHEGERPMAITWRLAHPIPIQFYRGMRMAA